MCSFFQISNSANLNLKNISLCNLHVHMTTDGYKKGHLNPNNGVQLSKSKSAEVNKRLKASVVLIQKKQKMSLKYFTNNK